MDTATVGGPALFATLNRFAEPAIRAGLGAPLPIPIGWWSGLVVMEIPGRRSGRLYRIPAVALAHRDMLIVTTVRSRSQWIRNLAAANTIEVWLRGHRRLARPMVWGHLNPRSVPALRERIAFRNLGLLCDLTGLSGALLTVEAGPTLVAPTTA